MMNLEEAKKLMYELNMNSDRSLDDGYQSYMITVDGERYGVISLDPLYGDNYDENVIIFESRDEFEQYQSEDE